MEKINVAELLRNCPKGMELDCIIFNGKVYFEGIDDNNSAYPIKISVNLVNIEHLDIYGQYNTRDYSKCVIFPKGKTTWEGFQRPFKDGDVIYNKGINALAIFNKQTDDGTFSHCFLNTLGELKICHYHSKDLSDWKFATEEKKQKLFQAIKDNDYRWNAETKTLDKLIESKEDTDDGIVNDEIVMSGIYFDRENYADEVELHLNKYEIEIRDGKTYAVFKNQETKTLKPKFKVDDKIKLKGGDEFGNEPKFKVGDRVKSIINQNEYTIVDIRKDVYIVYYATDKFGSHVYHVPFCDEDKFDLVTNKFDITTLKPFDSRVLVRHNRDNKWCASFFSHIDEDFHSHCNKFVTTSGKSYPYCIPYEGNEHLLNTTNDCDEFYRNL